MVKIRHLGSWRQNVKTRFSQKLSILQLYYFIYLLTTYRKPYIIGPLRSKMAEIRHLENRHDVIFSAEGGPIWIKFRRTVQNDIMSTAVIWSKSKPAVEFQYGGRLGEFHGMSSQSHVSHCRVLPLGKFTVMIPEPLPHATLQGAFIWRNQCHDRATLQGVKIPSAILKIVFRHILFIFNAVWALTSGGFRIVSDTLVWRWRMWWPWVVAQGHRKWHPFDRWRINKLWLCFVSIQVPFLWYWTSNNNVSLKSELEVIQGHSLQRYHANEILLTQQNKINPTTIENNTSCRYCGS